MAEDLAEIKSLMSISGSIVKLKRNFPAFSADIEDLEKAGEGYWSIRHNLEEAFNGGIAMGSKQLETPGSKAQTKGKAQSATESSNVANVFGMPPLKDILEDITERINRAVNKKQLIAALPEAEDSIERTFNEGVAESKELRRKCDMLLGRHRPARTRRNYSIATYISLRNWGLHPIQHRIQ